MVAKHVVSSRGHRLRSAEFPGSLLGFVAAWWKLAGRAQLRTSLVDREVCWTVKARKVQSCVATRRRSTCGINTIPEEEFFRLFPNLSICSELKLLRHLSEAVRAMMTMPLPNVSERLSSESPRGDRPLDVRRNSLARKGISSSGRRRLRHSSLE